MKIREIYYGKSYSKLYVFPWILKIYENRKISEKIVEKSQDHVYCFLILSQTFKNVHSFIQLEVLEIKISHRFQKTAPLHGPSYISCSREQLL